MNRRQRLVQERFLDNEEAVIKRLDTVYKTSLRDINKSISQLDKSIGELQKVYASIGDDDIGDLAAAFFKGRRRTYTPAEARETLQSMIQSKVYQKDFQKALQKQVGGILADMREKEYKAVSDYIQQCYEEAFVGTLYDLHGQGIPLCFPLDQEAMVRAVQLDSKISQGLYKRLGEDVPILKKKIMAQVSRGISTGMSWQEVAQQLAGISKIGYNNAVRIARTEGHRVQSQSCMDACYKAKERGADVVKQWDAALDDRTRESHAAVDGEIRELDEKFSNDLMFPGDPSGGAAEVINCRCRVLQRARWALDESELETLKRRAEYFGLDKTDSFEDFKRKYLKAAADDITFTRDDLKQRIKDDKARIASIRSDIRAIDNDIDNHYRTTYDDLKGLKKSEISDRIKAIEEREKEVNPIVDRLYNRPERGTPEYDAWREWKRTIDRDSIFEEQMRLASEKAELESKLSKYGRYENWQQWKKEHPLDVLNSQKTALLNEITNIEAEISDYKDQLANMVIPKSWKQITVEHDSAFDIKAANPHYSEGREYRVNCQRCVPTYEMRRRGYDVVAQPCLDWDKGDYLARHSAEAFEDAQVHWGLAGTGKRDIEKLLKEWGDGARAEVGVTWKGANSGHVFVAENIGGKIHYIDPQSGEMDVSWYFSNVRTQRTRVWRIDNLRPSEWIEKCCERRE